MVKNKMKQGVMKQSVKSHSKMDSKKKPSKAAGKPSLVKKPIPKAAAASKAGPKEQPAKGSGKKLPQKSGPNAGAKAVSKEQKSVGKLDSKKKSKALGKPTTKENAKSGTGKPEARKGDAAHIGAKVKIGGIPSKVSGQKVIVEKAAKAGKESTTKLSPPKPTELEISKAKALADKTAAAKKGKPKKTEEVDLEDDFIPEDDFGTSEIGEYEEELKAVETLDEEVDEDIDWTLESKSTTDDDIYLTDADGNRYCRAKDCDQIAAVDAYCRFHYLLYWKRIQVRNKILADGKFGKYVEELTARYPDKFLEMIRRDLRTQKDFLSAIQELEIDESENQSEGEEETQSFIDEVRGLGESSSMEDEEF